MSHDSQNGKKRRTQAELEQIRSALVSALSTDHPWTVRQAFYRMVVLGVIAKTEAGYETVGRLLLQMRLEERIPFAWIADNTRWVRKPQTFASMDDALQKMAQSYRRSIWDTQPVHVEIWSEKDALAGVLLAETVPFDVPLMVSRGFSSLSFLHDAAQAILARDKPAFVYYCGDHDPSGVHIDRVVERRLREFAPGAEIHFQRVAVTVAQIKQWNLPTRPTKSTDSRSKTFKGGSVEVDAIPPNELRALIRACITKHVDREALAAIQAAESSERERFERLAVRARRA
jgi:hypothetical protein